MTLLSNIFQLNWLGPNWTTFFLVWEIASFIFFVLNPAAGAALMFLGRAALKYALKKAARVAAKKALQAGAKRLGGEVVKAGAKGAVIAYFAAIFPFGPGKDGGPNPPPVSQNPHITNAAPENVSISFPRVDKGHETIVINEEEISLNSRSDYEAFYKEIEEKLNNLKTQGTKSVTLNLATYPGPDIVKQVESICDNFGITINESGDQENKINQPNEEQSDK